MINCDAVRELLADAGVEAVEVRPDIRSHLEGCPSCSRFLHKLQAIEIGLQNLPSEDMPDKVADAILQAVHADGQDAAPSERVSGRGSRTGYPLQTLGVAARQVLKLGWQQKWVVAGTMAVVMLAAGIGTYSLTPRYTALTVLEVRERAADLEAVLSSSSTSEGTIETEIGAIRSREIARRVIRDLNLHEDPEFNPNLRESSGLTRIGETGASLAPIVNAFLERLRVNERGQPGLITIRFESEDPEKAAAAANGVADFYIVAQLEAKFEATRRATTWLTERVEQLREDVSAKEQAIEDYRTRSGLLQGQARATLIDEQVRELNAQHVLEVARLAEAQARLRQANKLLNAPGGIASSVEALQSPLIRELRGRESLLERELAELSEEYGQRHPRLINAHAELRDLRAEIKRDVERIIQGLRNEVSVSEARAASLGAALRDIETEGADLSRSEVQLRALEREAKASRALLETLLEQARDAASQEGFQQVDASVVAYAAVPEDPSSPKTAKILGSALFGSLGLGLFLAFTLGGLKAKGRDRAKGHGTRPPLESPKPGRHPASLFGSPDADADRSSQFGWRPVWAVAAAIVLVVLVSGVGVFSFAPRFAAEIASWTGLDDGALATAQQDLAAAQERIAALEAELRADRKRIAEFQGKMLAAEHLLAQFRELAESRQAREEPSLMAEAGVQRPTLVQSEVQSSFPGADARVAGERIAELYESRRAAEIESARLRQELAAARQAQEVAQKETAAESEAQRRDLAAAQDKFAELDAEVRAAGARITTLDGELKTAKSESDRLGQELTAAQQAQGAALQESAAAAEAARKELSLALQVATAETARFRSNLRAAEREVASLAGELESAKWESAEFRRKLESTRKRIAALQLALTETTRTAKAASSGSTGTPDREPSGATRDRGTASQEATAGVLPQVPSASANEDYRLGTGDQLRITVFGHEDLSMESVNVDSAGRITLPLAGDLTVDSRTQKEVEEAIAAALSPRYLKNPVVSVEVLEHRDFYIIGEVADPGPYPYSGGMRVINAIAMAGGFTYRAVEDEFVIQRDGREIAASKDTPVRPGDVIEVEERFF
jgi:uncharacterized protein involved in exopolysaccharide biosynthesis